GPPWWTGTRRATIQSARLSSAGTPIMGGDDEGPQRTASGAVCVCLLADPEPERGCPPGPGACAAVSARRGRGPPPGRDLVRRPGDLGVVRGDPAPGPRAVAPPLPRQECPLPSWSPPGDGPRPGGIVPHALPTGEAAGRRVAFRQQDALRWPSIPRV